MTDALQRLPKCPFKIECRSTCKELPSEGSYKLISTEEAKDGTVTMVLELIEADDG